MEDWRDSGLNQFRYNIRIWYESSDTNVLMETVIPVIVFSNKNEYEWILELVE